MVVLLKQKKHRLQPAGRVHLSFVFNGYNAGLNACTMRGITQEVVMEQQRQRKQKSVWHGRGSQTLTLNVQVRN